MSSRDASIDGNPNARQEAEEQASNLAEGNPFSNVVEGAKSLYNTGQWEDETHVYTTQVTPEWYNEHIRGREELLGWGKKDPSTIFKEGTNILRPEVQQNYKNFFTPPPVDPVTMAAMGQAISKHWDTISEDPELMYLYRMHPMLLFADAELAAKTDDALNRELDLTTRTGAFITGQPTSPFTYEALEETLRKGDALSYFLDDYIGYFDREQQDTMAYLLSLTDIDRRETLAGNSVIWWEGKDPDDPTAQSEYIDWLSRAAQDAQAQTREEQGAWNKGLFNWLDSAFLTYQWKDLFRRNLMPNFQAILDGRMEDVDWTPGNRSWSSYIDVMNKYDPANYQYTGRVPNPKEWAYQTSLTTGQQTAAMAGLEKDSPSFGVVSSLVDGFLYVATPGDIAINVASGGMGYASKIARIGLEPTTKLGRMRLAAKVAIPVIGRRMARNTSGGKLPFGVATRVGWALRSKNIGEFMIEAEKRGVVRRMFDVTKAKGIGGLLNDFDNMVPIVDTGLDDMLQDAAFADNYDLFWEVLKHAQAGAFDVNPGAKVADLQKEAAQLRDEIASKVNAAVANALYKPAGKEAPTIAPDMVDELLQKAPDTVFIVEAKVGDNWHIAELPGEVGTFLSEGTTPAGWFQHMQENVGDVSGWRIRAVTKPDQLHLSFDPNNPEHLDILAKAMADSDAEHPVLDPTSLPEQYRLVEGWEPPTLNPDLWEIRTTADAIELVDLKSMDEDLVVSRFSNPDPDQFERYRKELTREAFALENRDRRIEELMSDPDLTDFELDKPTGVWSYKNADGDTVYTRLSEIDWRAADELLEPPKQGGAIIVKGLKGIEDEALTAAGVSDELLQTVTTKNDNLALGINPYFAGALGVDETATLSLRSLKDTQLSDEITFVSHADDVDGPVLETAAPGSRSVENVPVKAAYLLEWEDDPSGVVTSAERLTYNTIVDLGADHGRVDVEGNPLKRFLLMRRNDGPSLVTAHEMAFDTVDDAVAAALQINNDLKIMTNIGLPSGSWSEIGSDIGYGDSLPSPEKVEEFFNALISGDPDIVAKYDTPFRGDLAGWATFMRDPNNFPALALLARNSDLNTGSSMTQYLHKLWEYETGRVPVTGAMTDNIQAVHSQLEDAVRALSETVAQALRGETDPGSYVMGGQAEAYGSGTAFERARRVILRKFDYKTEAANAGRPVEPVADFVAKFVEDIHNQWEAEAVPTDFEPWLEANWQQLWRGWLTSPEAQPTTPEMQRIWTDVYRWSEIHTAYGANVDALNDIDVVSGVKPVAWNEPWDWKSKDTIRGNNLMMERPVAFTPEQRELFMNLGVRYYGKKMTDALGSADWFDAADEATFRGRLGKIYAERGDELRELATNAKEGDPDSILRLKEMLLGDWADVQTEWKKMLHYRYNGERGTLIPAVRGGRHAAYQRASSWTLNPLTGQNFTGGSPGRPLSLGFGYTDLDDAMFTTPENIIKMLTGNQNIAMGDTWNELIVRRDTIKGVSEYKLPWRFGNQLGTDVGLDELPTNNTKVNYQRLIRDVMVESDAGELPSPALQHVLDHLEDNFMFSPRPASIYGLYDEYDPTTTRPLLKGDLRTEAFIAEGGTSKSQLVDPSLRPKLTAVESQIAQLERLEGVQGIVYDLPKLKPYDAAVQSELKPSVRGRSNFRTAFRHYWARTFRSAMPETMDIGDSVNSVYDLRRVMRALAAEDDTIREVLTEFVTAPKEAREKVVMDAFKRVGRESGNPILEHMIDVMWKNTTNKRSTTSLAGTGVAEDLGQTANGVVPPTPSHGGDKIILPDESLFKAMARYRASGTLPTFARRGLTTSTKGKRKAIVEALKTKVGPKVVESFGDNADEELLKMAYAMVAPEGQPQWDGVGKFADWISRYPGNAWRWVHGTFTRSVLSLQPVRWMIKVALMEEPLRAGLMGMPNFVMNPKTSLRNIIHSFNISKFDSHVGKMNRAVDEVMAEFVSLERGSDEFMDFLRGLGMDDNIIAGNSDLNSVRRYVIERVMRPNVAFDDSMTAKHGIAQAVKDAHRSGLKVKKTMNKNVAAGLVPDFSWDDADEIVSKSLFSQYMTKAEGMRPVIYSPLKTEDHGVFARQWASEVVRIKRDPFLELAGDYRIAGDTDAVVRLQNHPKWPLWKTRAQQILDHKRPGIAAQSLSDRQLAEAYLDYLGEHVEQVLGPLLRPDSLQIGGSELSKVNDWVGLKTNELQTTWRGEILQYDLYDEESVAENLSRLIGANRGDATFNKLMPPFIDVPFTETFIRHGRQAEFYGKNLNAWRRFTNFMLSNFGERATQVLNRRPAYLWKFNKQYDMYRQLGVGEDIARRAAHRKAFRAVNYVYFNQDHIPPLVRKMNGIIPFFGAQVEIASTWAKKIPLAQGPFLGPVQLVRKIDKMFQGLVNSGILDVDYYEGDETRGEQNARYRLTFEPGGRNADTLFGQFVSDLGYRVQTGVLDTMLFVRNMLSDEPDMDAEDITQGRISYSFGNPLDWSKNNQGILAINQIYLTPTPGVKAAVSAVTRNLDITANNDLVPGGRMGAILAEHGVDRTEFLIENRALFVKLYGKKKYDDLIDSDEDFNLDPEVGWEIPGTSLYDSFVKPWLYPMGFPENEVYTWTEFIPSTWKYMMRGLAIGMGSEDPTSFWNVNPDTGELEVNGFLQNVMLPTASDKYLAASAVRTSIQDYEARTGALSRYGDLALRKAEIAELALLAKEASRNPDGKLLFDSKFGSQYEKEYNEIVAEQEMLWRDILHHGFVGASNQIGMRGLFGFVSPATPRFIRDEQQAIAGYWDARQNAQGEFNNLYHDFNPLGVTDVDAFNQLFVDFLEDRSGDQAMQTLRGELPELWAHAYGSTFWAADGAPAEITQIDDFFEQIENGQRQPFAPHVNLQRMFRAHVAASREAQILETYGDDPYESAASMLGDWFNYNQNIVDPSRKAFDQLDWHDEIVTDSDYANYRDLVFGTDEEDTLQAEFRRDLDDMREAIEELEELIPGLYAGAEGVENANVLSTMAQNISDLSERVGGGFERVGLQSERERILSWYFDSQVSKYYQELSYAYDKLDQVTTNQDASRIYDQIRLIDDKWGAPVNYMGRAFPSVQDWRWSRLSPEEQDLKVQEWVTQPVEWLSADAITRVTNMYPEAANYLPKTAGAYNALIQYGKVKDGINEAATFDPETGLPYLTEGERRKAQAALERQMRGNLLQAGLGDMVQWMEMWPIERMATVGAIPPNVEELAGQASWLRQSLEAAGKTAGKQEVVRNIIDPFYVQHVQKMETDPVYATFFRTLGRDLYDEIDDRKVFERFVLGDRSLY